MATNFLHSKGSHTLRTRNINAPLPTGARPFGGGNGIYLYETSGVYRQNQWITNVNAKVNSKLTLSGFYAFGSAHGNTDRADSLPADQYDLLNEFGRTTFNIRHRFQFNRTVTPKWGVRFSPFVTLTSGRPCDVVNGTDTNGDGIFNDRPALAADVTRASIVSTKLGAFDKSPIPGQATLPRNFGEGPTQIAINLRVSKSFDLGRDPSGKKNSDPKQISISVNARNIINHPDPVSPTGNLSSLLFGQSTLLAGGQGAAGTRRIDLQLKFSF